MKAHRQTLSLCPTCYLEIPALITIGSDGVTMKKRCPAHGEFESIVERDPLFYLHAISLGQTSIYPGHFVDVTRTCNLRCEPCFYRLELKDPKGAFSVESIVNECLVNVDAKHFILTGGEPTLHPEIDRIITEVSKIGRVEMLTNGVKLAKEEEFKRISPLLTDANGVCHLHLSIHHKETDAWKEVLALAKSNFVKLASALIVVESEDEFFNAISIATEYRDVVLSWRIKAASNLWNSKDGKEKIFVSDMLRWMENTGKPVEHVAMANNKSCFYNVRFNGIHLMLVSWFDVTNVDLIDINCAPTYRARNGQVANFVTAALINEGIDAGWIRGAKTFDQVFKQSKSEVVA